MAVDQGRAWTPAERRWGVLFLVVTVGSLIAVAAFDPGLVTFWPFTAAEFVQFLTPLFLVSLFIERTLEVFLTAWRAEGAAKLETQVKAAKAAKAAPGAAPDAHAATEDTVIQHKAGTQRMAFLGGVTLGIVVSAVGVRALGMFVDPAVFGSLSDTQQTMFNVTDVLLTGAVLGGGADGLHKLVSVFTNFMDVTAKRVKEGGGS